MSLLAPPAEIPGGVGDQAKTQSSALGLYLLTLAADVAVRPVLTALAAVAEPSVLVVMFAVAACSHLGIFHAAAMPENKLPPARVGDPLPRSFKVMSMNYAVGAQKFNREVQGESGSEPRPEYLTQTEAD